MKKKSLFITIAVSVSALCLIVAAFFVTGYLKEKNLDDIQNEQLSELERYDGQYDDHSIVLQNTNPGTAKQLAEKLGAKLRITADGSFATLTLPSDITVADIYNDDENREYLEKFSLDLYASTSEVEEIEDTHLPAAPKYSVSDAFYSRQNYLNYLHMENVWGCYRGDGITVAVIDTGIDTDHPEFTGKISEYSYNATEDKIVKDYDNDWSLIEDEQEVYRGKSAKAPNVPVVPDATFDKWDYDYSNIQSDVTIKPVYIAAAEYTVTFISVDGVTLKTETVISGHDATAPTAPTVAGKIFAGWDKSFTNVKSDITVRATYRNPNNYTVTFKDFNGLVLGTSNVVEGENATAPSNPSRDGYSFTGWSTSIKNVTGNITAVAQYKFNGGTNVFDIVPSISGSTLTITVSIKGSVKVCGFEGSLAVPSGLTCKSATAGTGDTTVNVKDGNIYFMFSSSTGKNVTSETKLFTATFTIGSVSNASFTMEIKDIYDQDFGDVKFSVVGKKVRVK